jgi:hypothetical protein
LSWRKYFTPVNRNGLLSPISGESPGPTGSKSNYSSYLPDVYTGSPNRIERYLQYDTMDMDSEVNAALDIISEFSTQINTENGTPFFIEFMDKASSVEVKLLRDYLQKWCKLQHFETRMFRVFRNTIKYGDSFFIRDPETKKWFYIDPGKVVKIIVNESEGKKPEQYVIRDINPNFTHMVVTQINPSNQNTQPGGTAYVTGGAGARGMTGAYPQQSGTRYSIAQNEVAIEAKHVVHLSLSEGLDNNYPFGNSLLESVFKVYKQKELLEDAIIIYRVQRAPERRVFYIDVGNMPSHMAMQFVERVKNEIHQRRIPSSTGGTSSVVDAGYSPMSTNEDYYFPQTCISLDTKIKLLDNRDLPLHEIINEYENGKINYAYTVNQQTHTIEPGKIVWAGVTRKNAEVVEVTLDNGESVVVTPDHRFIMRDGSEKEARQLETGDEIMSLGTTITVESVETLLKNIDTGDITIESVSGSHNFALSVGIFVHNSEGRGSKVDTLPGGTNLGEIDDLRYFTNKLFRALRIPSSYLPTGADDSASQFNDGRVGTAYIQELRFNKYCQRLQRLIEEEFNLEFKLYLHQNGIIIDGSIFNIRFNPPQNFAAYRLSELDTVRVQTFSSIQEIPYFSKRFLMKRMLGFSEEEIVENERLWREENREIGDNSPGAQAEMRGMGITSGGIQSDLGGGDMAGMEAGAEGGEPGAEAGAVPIPSTPEPTPPTPQ